MKEIDKVILKLENRLANDMANIDDLIDETSKLVLFEAKPSGSTSCITKKYCKFLLNWILKYSDSIKVVFEFRYKVYYCFYESLS